MQIKLSAKIVLRYLHLDHMAANTGRSSPEIQQESLTFLAGNTKIDFNLFPQYKEGKLGALRQNQNHAVVKPKG